MPFGRASSSILSLVHSGRIVAIPNAAEAVTIMMSISLNGLQRGMAALVVGVDRIVSG